MDVSLLRTFWKKIVGRSTAGPIGLALLATAALPLSGHSATQIAAWGDNANGQLNVPASLTNAVAVAAGFTCLAIRDNWSVAAWGANSVGQTNVPADLT